MGPHYASWVKKNYANLLTNLGQFENAILFIQRYDGSAHINERTKDNMDIILAFAFLKTGQTRKAKDIFEEYASANKPITLKKIDKAFGSAIDTKFKKKCARRNGCVCFSRIKQPISN